MTSAVSAVLRATSVGSRSGSDFLHSTNRARSPPGVRWRSNKQSPITPLGGAAGTTFPDAEAPGRRPRHQTWTRDWRTRVDIVVKSRHHEVTDRFRRHVMDKLAKAQEMDGKAISLTVVLGEEKNPRQAE